MRTGLLVASWVTGCVLLAAVVVDVAYWTREARCDSWEPENEVVLLSVFLARLLVTEWLNRVGRWPGMSRSVAFSDTMRVHDYAWIAVDLVVFVGAVLRVSYFASVAEDHRRAYYPGAEPAGKLAWWIVLGLTGATGAVRTWSLCRRTAVPGVQ